MNANGAFNLPGGPTLGPLDGIPELDAVDIDSLLTYLNQPPGADINDPSLSIGLNQMNAQIPFRNETFAGLPLLNPATNLFAGMTFPGMSLPQEPAQPNTNSGPTSDSGMDEPGRGSKSKSSGGEDKQSAIQEKNRRAQKRFRERQKAKLQDMTEQLDDMGVELSKLRMENNSLKNRNHVLEKVLTLRDEHIRTLQDEQSVFDLGSQYGQNGTMRLMDNPQHKQQLLLTGNGAPANAEGGSKPGPAAMMVANADAAALVDPSDLRAIKAMSPEAVIDRWKDVVRELGTLLVDLEVAQNPNDVKCKEAMTRLCTVLDSAGQLCMHTAVLHPTNMQRLISTTLDEGRSGASAEDRNRWVSVATALRLSEEQQQQLMALRQLFVRRMAKVLEDRREVLNKLQAVTIPDRMVALQSVISETLKVSEATAALKANLQEEHLCGLEFIGTVFKTIFSPIQKAKAIVQSYPFYPDIFQIASAVAAERGEEAIALPTVPIGAGAPDGDNTITLSNFLDNPHAFATAT